jgi:hydroxymethylpyrimidine pyrophosphatase-like HAD family hydrolase
MRIAVDFDGTIVEDRYPHIGPEQTHAIGVLKLLQSNGHQLILWTQRCGAQLEEALEFCQSKGLAFYAVNKNYPGEMPEKDSGRKIRADLFIDKNNLGGILNWTEIFWMIQLNMVG